MSRFVCRSAVQNNDTAAMAIIEELCGEFSLPKAIGNMLYARGFDSADKLREFLEPSVDWLLPCGSLADMDKAVDVITRAIATGKRIFIYGDYDVDGITSTALLLRSFAATGIPADYYVPDREKEGYGLNCNAIRTLAERGCKLLITVDCGITSVAEAKLAAELGIELVITDHHNCPEELPSAVAIVNPKRKDANGRYIYGNPGLAGVGTAFKLAEAVCGRAIALECIDLVGFGTISDIVPLTGENRIFAALGLKKLKEKPCLGFKALIDVSCSEGSTIDEETVGFRLGPRLNASGRMLNAKMGIELLTTEDEQNAAALAAKLNAANGERQELEHKAAAEAAKLVKSLYDNGEDRLLLLVGSGWHKGVIGIAASKITDKTGRPSILMTVEEGVGVASCRSVAGFDIYTCLAGIKGLFLKFGGHSMAAGFSIAEENIPKLRAYLKEYAEKNLPYELLLPKNVYDCELSLSDVTEELVNLLGRFAPYGEGNPAPKFLFKGVKLDQPTACGKDNNTLRFTASQEAAIPIKCIAFGQGALAEKLHTGDLIDMVASARLNSFRGEVHCELWPDEFMPAVATRDQLFNLTRNAVSNFTSYLRGGNYLHKADLMVAEHINERAAANRFSHELMGSTVLCWSRAGAMKARAVCRLPFYSGMVMGKDSSGVSCVVYLPTELPEGKKLYMYDFDLPFVTVGADFFAGRAVTVIDTEPGFYAKVGEGASLDATLMRGLYVGVVNLCRRQNTFNGSESLMKLLSSNIKINALQTELGIRVFEELGFIRLQQFGPVIQLYVVNGVRHGLGESSLYRLCMDWQSEWWNNSEV